MAAGVLRRVRLRVPLSVVIVSVPVVLRLVPLLLSMGGAFTPGGDVAVFELELRHLFHDFTGLGPYSRFGWRHPGPAMTYAFAPLFWLSGKQTQSLFVTSFLLNSACLIGVVVLVRQAAGEWAARLAAVLGVTVLVCLGATAVINPWNPSLLPLPVLLLLVASARAATGSPAALVVAFAAGTFAAQTHLSTAPLVAVALSVGLAGCAARRGQLGPLRRPLIVAGVLFAVCWGPPIVEQLAGGREGNVAIIVRSYRNPPEWVAPLGHPWSDSFGYIADQATVFPFSPLGQGPARPRASFVWGACALGAVVFAAAWRRARFLAWLGLMTPVSVALAVFGATRVMGEPFPYLFYASQLLLLPLVLASGALVVLWAEKAGRVSLMRVVGAVPLLMALVYGYGWAMRAPETSFGDSPDARAAAAAIQDRMGHDRSIVFRVSTVGYGYNAATLLELDRAGYKYRLTHDYSLYDGNTDKPVEGPTFLVLEVPPDRPERLADHVAKVGALDVWIEPHVGGPGESA